MKILVAHRKKIRIITYVLLTCIFITMVRLTYVVVFEGEKLNESAINLHERERVIKAKRGRIISSDGVVLADNETVCTISVIHSEVKEPEKIIEIISRELSMDEKKVRKYVEKNTAIEKIKTNVDKEVAERIRQYNLSGVKIDEDSKRVYPYSELASKVLGFTGADNQGIIGLEVQYEDTLKGTNGKILTVTDAKGVEQENKETKRIEPVAGADLYVSIDYNIQTYAMELAKIAYNSNQAKNTSIIVINPANGEILAMVNYPEYNLNEPFDTEGTDYADYNQMWRNSLINDTYEPGSIFKIITATAALKSGAVSLNNNFYCSGKQHVADRFIRCANTNGHGAQTFADTLKNSCNPAFITWGLMTGKENMVDTMKHLGLYEKSGIDLPGEAKSIMHKTEDIKELDLAVMSFGQSFQITALELIRAVCAVVNGGTLVTPHFGVSTKKADGSICTLEYDKKDNIIEPGISETMKTLLKGVVETGGGSACKIEGYSIAGKTATSEKLPRGNGKYIASFIGIAPAENPKVVAMCIIDEPTGAYYGGMIAAPVIKSLFENILPYLGINK